MKRIWFIFLGLLFIASSVYAQPIRGGGGSSIERSLSSVGTDLTLENGETISNSTNGKVCLKGGGGTNNEDLCFDLETTANAVTTFSNTSATTIDYGVMSVGLQDDSQFKFGTGNDLRMEFETQGNDNFQVGLRVGSSAYSGYYSIMEQADMGNANRSPTGTSAYPIQRWYSEDATVAADYGEAGHNAIDCVIANGEGQIKIDSVSDITLDADGMDFFFVDNLSGLFRIRGDLTNAETKLGLYDETGNQFIITNSGNVTLDHDHAVQTNPTLYGHSDNSPDKSNSEYWSVTHDQSDTVINSGFGGIKLGVDAQPARGTMTLTGLPVAEESFVINATTVTAKASGATGDQFNIGGTAAATVTAIVAAVNAGTEAANVHAYDGAGDTVVFEWLTKGTAGNSIVFTESMTNTAVDGAGTLGTTHAGIAAATVASVQNGGVVLQKVTADPCTVLGEGALFYNDTGNYMCYCNGANDVKMSDDSTACF